MTVPAYPSVSKVEVMLTYELFDRSDDDAPEMDVDHDAANRAALRIEEECREVFPNAEFFWSMDGAQYASWFTHAESDDLTITETYKIEATLQEIVDANTIYYTD